MRHHYGQLGYVKLVTTQWVLQWTQPPDQSLIFTADDHVSHLWCYGVSKDITKHSSSIPE